MRREIIAAVAATAVLASAQVVSAQRAVIDITLPQRTMIKEYVVKERVKPVTLKERVTVGVTIPTDVDLMAVPETWGPSLVNYRYVYSDSQVVLVEPSSRRVVQIID